MDRLHTVMKPTLVCFEKRNMNDDETKERRELEAFYVYIYIVYLVNKFAILIKSFVHKMKYSFKIRREVVKNK